MAKTNKRSFEIAQIALIIKLTFIWVLVINVATVDIFQIPVLYTVSVFSAVCDCVAGWLALAPSKLLNNLYLFTVLNSTQTRHNLSLR